MKINKYYKFPPEPIDIFKKEPDYDNLIINWLEKEVFKHSEQHQYLKALITEMNKKIKSKPASSMPAIVDVINYWLIQD